MSALLPDHNKEVDEPSIVSDRPTPDTVVTEGGSLPPGTNVDEAPLSKSPPPQTDCTNPLRPSGYVSPQEVLPFRNAAPLKKRGGRKRGISTIVTSTPHKESMKKHKRDKDEAHPRTTSRKRLLPTLTQSDDVADHNSSDDKSSGRSTKDEDYENCAIGDYVVVKFEGKKQAVCYIGLIDGLYDEDYEGKLFGKTNAFCDGWPIFKRKEEDEGSFCRQDVVEKPSPPVFITKTARREEFVFMNNRNRWEDSLLIFKQRTKFSSHGKVITLLKEIMFYFPPL